MTPTEAAGPAVAAGPTAARADLHVHSKASNRPTEWILRHFGAPESFTEPKEVYRLCRERGMDFVTLSDHDTILGALEIAHLPGTFLSEEVTVEFPEDRCQIHCLVFGISEAQHGAIQELRENVYELRDYLGAEGIVHSVAHPLYRVNNLLTLEQLEKLLVLFNRFEARNGIHDRRGNDLVARLFGALTREVIEDLAVRHRLQPWGPTPWIKSFTGGSDDHGGFYVASTHTGTPPAANVGQYLAHLAAGNHQPGGEDGSSLRLTQSLYAIAHEFHRRQFPLGLGSRSDPFAELLRSFALGQRGRTGERARAGAGRGGAPPPPAAERATFDAANRASQEITTALVDGFLRHARRGRLSEGLAAAAGQLAPLALTVAPYLVALQAQHKDADLLEMVARRFSRRAAAADLAEDRSDLSPAVSGANGGNGGSGGRGGRGGLGAEAGRRVPRPAGAKAWFTDTLTDVNGVAKTIRTLAGLARQRGRRLDAITCGEEMTPPDLPVHDFRPVLRFPLPGYETQTLTVPPLLELLEHCERERYGEILISTPGPLGLAGLAAAKLLGIPATGIYHTDFPLYVRHLSGSSALEEMTWSYMRWFFGQMDEVLVASRCYLELLAEHGLDRARLSLLPRGVDARFFHPGKRDLAFWHRFGIESGGRYGRLADDLRGCGDRRDRHDGRDEGSFKFLYVGRVSREKNVDALLAAFLEVLASGRPAHLAVVGDGPYLKELVRRYRQPEILFTGFLHGEELAKAYAGADLFVFPSTTDTFGNVVLEAQAAGLAAIVSDRGGPPEIVGAHDSGLIVDPDRPGDLAAAMRRLYDDPALRAAMAARGLAHARRHGWEQLLERLFATRSGAGAAHAAHERP
ncbi:MAG TPA: glycosyltransferase [Thermoanaerobaculia bacterium]|nr:glycosyltransferase [Thermoanaerobaculia bacterium]